MDLGIAAKGADAAEAETLIAPVLGGDTASIRIRAATLALDLLRRSLPASR